MSKEFSEAGRYAKVQEFRNMPWAKARAPYKFDKACTKRKVGWAVATAALTGAASITAAVLMAPQHNSMMDAPARNNTTLVTFTMQLRQ